MNIEELASRPSSQEEEVLAMQVMERYIRGVVNKRLLWWMAPLIVCNLLLLARGLVAEQPLPNAAPVIDRPHAALHLMAWARR